MTEKPEPVSAFAFVRDGVIFDIAMTQDEVDRAITLFYGETVRVIPVTITAKDE